jgi:hypothetical protein
MLADLSDLPSQLFKHGGSPGSRRRSVVACATLITLCAAFAAYYRVFVSLANYDDEGYMIWTVKNFLAGHALYDQVSTVYGPFFYLYEWCVLTATGVPAASDSLRLVSAAFWVAAALIAFVLAYRATGSLLMAACVHLVAFRALSFIGEEPVHPQEACIALLLALGGAFYVANQTLRMVIVGAIGGALAASKINLGIFVVVAVAVGITYARPFGWRRCVACICVSLGALALPAVLMWDRLAEAWAVSYCALVSLSLASVMLTVWATPWKSGRSLHDTVLLVGVFAGTAAIICCFALTHGSTLHKLFEWLIVLPRREYGHSWSLPANIHYAAPVWAVVGLIFAGLVRTGRVADRRLSMVKLAFGVAVLLMCATDRYAGLLNFAPPFLWLVAARPSNVSSGERYTSANAMLALLGTIQALYAYPVAGSQVNFVAVLIIVVAGISFWDGLSWCLCDRVQVRPNRTWKWVPTAVQVAAVMSIAGLNLACAWNARIIYESFSALDFPGATNVRVEADKATALRAIISRINSSCGTLITEPGLFSFHLWTGKPSPPGVDHQVWMSLLADTAQSSIVREIARDPRACVVYQQDVVDLWIHSMDVSAKPLVRFIHENFEPVFEGSGYSLMMRSRSRT